MNESKTNIILGILAVFFLLATVFFASLFVSLRSELRMRDNEIKTLSDQIALLKERGVRLEVVVPSGGEEFLMGIPFFIQWQGNLRDHYRIFAMRVGSEKRELIKGNLTGLGIEWKAGELPSPTGITRSLEPGSYRIQVEDSTTGDTAVSNVFSLTLKEEPILISQWETYRRDAYRFEIKYPPNWFSQEVKTPFFSLHLRKPSAFSVDPRNDEMRLEILPVFAFPPETWKKYIPVSFSDGKGAASIAGLPGTLKGWSNGQASADYFLTQDKRFLFVFVPQLNPMLEKIFSTFTPLP